MGLAGFFVPFQPVFEAAANLTYLLVGSVDIHKLMSGCSGIPARRFSGPGGDGLWKVRLAIGLDDPDKRFEYGSGFAPEGGDPAYDFRLVTVESNGFGNFVNQIISRPVGEVVLRLRLLPRPVSLGLVYHWPARLVDETPESCCKVFVVTSVPWFGGIGHYGGAVHH